MILTCLLPLVIIFIASGTYIRFYYLFTTYDIHFECVGVCAHTMMMLFRCSLHFEYPGCVPFACVCLCPCQRLCVCVLCTVYQFDPKSFLCVLINHRAEKAKRRIEVGQQPRINTIICSILLHLFTLAMRAKAKQNS